MNRFLARLLAAFLVAASIAGMSTVPAQAADGTFLIYAAPQRVGRCVDVPAASLVVGKKIQTWDCQYSPRKPGQTFRKWEEAAGGQVFGLRNTNSGLCLAGWAKGSQLTQEFCNANMPSRTMWRAWLADGTTNRYFLVNQVTGLCLAIPGGAITNGTWLVTWDCKMSPTDSAQDQLWTFVA
ncbi:RICIN domain-containing protein [Asanoa iriomotensis]|uniref:Ricin B lectin domain-containing protein n=1 Tax=Asanoa iriomotensis TaxID=234613 RepID=A0ABQ4C2N6_9ACTN|nr:RICIN domain-containing protein [Asanoa iriomotensis]GIF56560.1 hypothetical protein Air01nite_26550 [Asanoa iriomotensis]